MRGSWWKCPTGVVRDARMARAREAGGPCVWEVWVHLQTHCYEAGTDTVDDTVLPKLGVPTRELKRGLKALGEAGVITRTDTGWCLVGAPSSARRVPDVRPSKVRRVPEVAPTCAVDVPEVCRPALNENRDLPTPIREEKNREEKRKESVKEKSTHPSLELRPAPDGGSPVPPWVSLPAEATFRPMVQRVFPADFVPDAQDAKVAARYGLDREEVARVVRDLRGSVVGGNGFLPGREHQYFRRALGWAKDRKEQQGKRTG